MGSVLERVLVGVVVCLIVASIGGIIRVYSEFQVVKVRLDRLECDKSDLPQLKNDIAQLKSDLPQLKNDIAQLQHDQTSDKGSGGAGTTMPVKPEVKKLDDIVAAQVVKPDDLVVAGRLPEIVKEQQRKHVKESYGELAYQCFTDADLQRFKDTKSAERIAEGLKTQKDFLQIVLALKRLPTPECQAILDRSQKPLRPTFSELGKISREGQTEAGQNAELLIAEAVVRMVKELLKLPMSQLESLYESNLPQS